MKFFFELKILKTKNSFVLSAMELPFVGGNGVVKKPKNPGMFLMVSYMLQKGNCWLLLSSQNH